MEDLDPDKVHGPDVISLYVNKECPEPLNRLLKMFRILMEEGLVQMIGSRQMMS